MKTKTKVFSVLAGAAATAYAAVSVSKQYKQYQKFKRMENAIDHLPLHKLESKTSGIHENGDKMVIELPKNTTVADKLRICKEVITAKENR